MLGETGRNFGAGASGGIAFMYDREEQALPADATCDMIDLDPLAKKMTSQCSMIC